MVWAGRLIPVATILFGRRTSVAELLPALGSYLAEPLPGPQNPWAELLADLVWSGVACSALACSGLVWFG